MGITFDKDLLAVEQNKCLSKILKICIVYDLDVWPKKILLTISNLRKNSKNSDKENYVQSGYGITFDKAGS